MLRHVLILLIVLNLSVASGLASAGGGQRCLIDRKWAQECKAQEMQDKRFKELDREAAELVKKTHLDKGNRGPGKKFR